MYTYIQHFLESSYFACNFFYILKTNGQIYTKTAIAAKLCSCSYTFDSAHYTIKYFSRDPKYR